MGTTRRDEEQRSKKEVKATRDLVHVIQLLLRVR
jgi:hypothetical protein